MRIQVNLATRPFVELRPFFLRLRLLMVALVLLAVGTVVGAHLLSVRVARQQREMDSLRDQTIAAQQVRLQTERRLRLPDNAAVLDRAHFLNTLFLRKSFSWTAVMMDLENVLPVGVQVTSIEPAVAKDGSVLIRLRVAGERPRAVELVRNLERSRRFLYPRLGSEAAQSREGAGANGTGRPGNVNPTLPPPPSGVEFEILATYNPLPAGQAYHEGHPRVLPTAASGADVRMPTVAMAAVPAPRRGAREAAYGGGLLPSYRNRATAPGTGRPGAADGGVR